MQLKKKKKGTCLAHLRNLEDVFHLFFFFLDYCLHLYCYFHNVSADMSSSLLQVFVELGNLHGTSNYKGWRIYQLKCWGNNDKDEDNSPKTLNDENHQAFSQKFKQHRGCVKKFIWCHIYCWFFYQWDTNTVTPLEEMCEPQRQLR